MSYSARGGHGYGSNQRKRSGLHLWGKKIPDKITDKLLTAKTAREASELVSKKEKAIANFIDRDKEGYLDCDEAAEILSQVLTVKGIEHEVVIGKSAEGSSHAYVKAKEDGKEILLDPTDQL